MNQAGYKCPKWENQKKETGEFSVTSGGFSKIFDVQNKKLPPLVVPDVRIQKFIKLATVN